MSYEDVVRQMEREMRRSEEIFWRFVHASAPEKFWEPRVDVYETANAVKVKVELAGVRPRSVNIELSGDGRQLAVRGIRVDEDPDVEDRSVFHQMEIYLGPFERTIALPPKLRVDRDGIKASYKDGLLLIVLPKVTEPERKTTQIPVRG